jgi:hypothetical protein
MLPRRGFRAKVSRDIFQPAEGAELSLDSTRDSHAERRKHMRRLRALPRSKDPQRSKVANGRKLIPGVSGHSVWIRRAKEHIADAIADLGGEANTSAAERNLVRRAATLSVELERLEAKFATAGEADPADLDLYQKLSNTLRRLLAALGLHRRPRDVSVAPDLTTYLRGRGTSRSAAE